MHPDIEVRPWQPGLSPDEGLDGITAAESVMRTPAARREAARVNDSATRGVAPVTPIRGISTSTQVIGITEGPEIVTHRLTESSLLTFANPYHHLNGPCVTEQ